MYHREALTIMCAMHAYHGLDPQEVISRREKYGLNEVPEQSQSNLLHEFFHDLRSQGNLLLAIAGVVAFSLGEYLEGAIIIISILLNTAIQVFQSYKANQAVDALKKLSSYEVRVIRSGQESRIPSHELVPNDIVYLEEGSRIPADGTYLGGTELEADESLLTGESLRIAKQPKESLMSGTYVSSGNGYMQVTATGASSALGKIIQKVQSVKTPQTPLEKLLVTLTGRLSLLGLALSSIVCTLLVLNGSEFAAALIISLAFAVAFIPEGLPLVLTVILSYGVKQLAGHKAIAKNIGVIEALGGIDTIVTDKTGTITSNQMVVSEVYYPAPSQTARHLSCLIANLCNHTTIVSSSTSGKGTIVGDSTEGALLMYSSAQGVDPMTTLSEWTIEGEIPFSSIRKYMAVLCKHNTHSQNRFAYLKGAPEIILHMCDRALIGDVVHPLSEVRVQEFSKVMESYAKKGKRLIAVAYQSHAPHASTEVPTTHYIFVGFFAIMDPLQPHIAEVVDASKNMGITTYMATGDHPQMALHIARLAHIASDHDTVITGTDLLTLTDAQLGHMILTSKVFARVQPEDKQRITQTLQQMGHFVALTGDGVNDTIALKQADVGIAMGMKGSDAAKEVAQIVLADDNFATLIDALHAGRAIIQKLKRSIMFLLATNCMEAGILLFGVIAQFAGVLSNTHASLLTPLQLLYINLVTDSVPAFAFAFMPITRLPHETSKKHSLQDFFSSRTIGKIVGTASLGIVISLAAYFYMLDINPVRAQGFLFSTLVAVQIWVFVDEWISQGYHKINTFFIVITIGMFAFHAVSMLYIGVVRSGYAVPETLNHIVSSILLASTILLAKMGYRVVREMLRPSVVRNT